jgi:hypothetical protein
MENATMFHLEQIGDYVVERMRAGPRVIYGVRIAGSVEFISEHDSEDAMKRYQAGDKRRAAR